MKPEIERIERLLPHLQRADFPWPAYRLFVDSRRLYNETRRTILPMRLHTLASVRAATAGLAPAQERAREAVELLARGGRSDLADNVRAWLRFVEDEAARCVPPAMPCPSGPTTGFVPLRHNHCFRRGESFVDDYLDFFEAPDYLQTTGLAFSVHRTAAALVVTLRERANDIPARLAYWEKMQSDANSSSFVMRVYLDPDGRGASHRTVIVWPRGESVSLDRLSGVKAATTFANDDAWWQGTVELPFALLGRRPPRRGEAWGLNVESNPFIAAHRGYTWAPQYDAVNPRLFGRLRFN